MDPWDAWHVLIISKCRKDLNINVNIYGNKRKMFIKNELENKVLLLQTIFRCLAHIRIFTCSVKCDEELMVLLPPCSLHSFPSCTSSCSRKLNHLMERPNGVKCRGCVLTMVPLYSTKPIFHYPKNPVF